MNNKGITKKRIVEVATDMVEKSGRPEVSMRELAKEMGIKAPSLYNHIGSMDELLAEVCKYAVAVFNMTQIEAVKGKNGDEAIIALGNSYRTFAKEHSGLYRAIMAIPSEQGGKFSEFASAITEPVMCVLDFYDISKNQKMHWQRILRGTLHGFVSQEMAGYFTHYPVSVDESFRLCLDSMIYSLRKEETDHENR